MSTDSPGHRTPPAAQPDGPRLRAARAARGGRHLRHHPARRQPAGGAVAHGGRQAAGGRAARPSGRDLHRGRLAGRQSRRTTSSSAGPRPSSRSPPPPWWPSGRPAGPVCAAEDDDVLRNLVDAQTPAVCIVAKAWDRHVDRRPADLARRGGGHGGRLGGLPREHGLRVFFDAEHFFDGYRHNPEFALRVLARPRRPGPKRWCCATPTAGSLPHDVERGRGRRRRPGSSAQVGHPLPQRLGLCGGQLAGRGAGRRHPGPGVRQRLRRAGRQRRPVGGHPQPLAQARHPHHPAPTGWSG